ncbi:lysylphosphatidylglycerol synthase transmembrane domain-containing protein [Gehongia tenuis]|uniref:Phosphatidylglycerol lysyltransferase n=1 Tax=Gehongia tenuis TaxID=2763655 RepID=A0A926D6A2_9FIRM|nr:lysylphosphatidylglycerol synthase transmembrane domain-containing protein [Gehongia tenuis]MBC8532222.1 flippase-like domain-containing protein [Gehongia tenuis]
MKRKKILMLLYFLFTIGLLLYIAWANPEWKDIGKAIPSFKVQWILLSLAFMVLYVLLDGVSIGLLGRLYGRERFVGSGIKVALIGKYYSAVTPFSTGGQPWQIYSLNKAGLNPGHASSLLITKFFIYQTLLTIFSIVGFAVHAGEVFHLSKVFFYAAVFGILFNAFSPLIIILFTRHPKALDKLLQWVVKLLHKVRIVRFADQAEESMHRVVADFTDGIAFCKKDKKLVARVVLYNVFELFFYYSIPYFLYRGLGLAEVTLWDSYTLSLVVFLVMCFFPLPGGTGAAESGYMYLFSLQFPRESLFVTMLMWRAITYYLLIVVGSVVVMGDSFLRNRRQKKTAAEAEPAVDMADEN